MAMKRSGKALLAVLGTLAVVWLASRLLFEAQLPDREHRRGTFPDPMAPELSLRAAYDALPHEGGANGKVHLLEDNVDAWTARWRLLAEARERIDIGFFILKPDVFGVAMLGHLAQRAQEGLPIRIVFDALGAEMSDGIFGLSYLDVLLEAGEVGIRIYRPMRQRYLDAFLTLNPAAIAAGDHAKILLVDDRDAVIGGRNISDEYFTPQQDHLMAFHDTDVMLSGPRIASGLKHSFEVRYFSREARARRSEPASPEALMELTLAYRAMDAWLRAEPVPDEVQSAIEQRGLPWLRQLRAMPHLRGALLARPPAPIEAEVRLLDSWTRLLEADDPITRSLIRLARSARREIFVQSPYVVLTRDAVAILEEAAERGVAITLFTNSPSSSDNAPSQALFLEQWPEIMARIPTLRLFVAGDRRNLHGKYGVIDRELGLVGTYNLEPASMSLSSELMAAVWSEEFASELLAKPRRLIEAGPPLVYEYHIARDPAGRAVRDADGQVVVTFGHEDHTEVPDAIQRYRSLVRALRLLPVEWPVPLNGREAAGGERTRENP